MSVGKVASHSSVSESGVQGRGGGHNIFTRPGPSLSTSTFSGCGLGLLPRSRTGTMW